MSLHKALVDTNTLSEVMKGRDEGVMRRSATYLAEHGRFCFSLITRYEILRGLIAKSATRQLERFEERSAESEVLSLDDPVIMRAAEIYAGLRQSGTIILDADILIAATALVHGLPLVTENSKHFQRITGLTVVSRRSQ
jgi:tRNA(fMet)-specific endonuclease VapC